MWENWGRYFSLLKCVKIKILIRSNRMELWVVKTIPQIMAYWWVGVKTACIVHVCVNFCIFEFVICFVNFFYYCELWFSTQCVLLFLLLVFFTDVELFGWNIKTNTHIFYCCSNLLLLHIFISLLILLIAVTMRCYWDCVFFWSFNHYFQVIPLP